MVLPPLAWLTALLTLTPVSAGTGAGQRLVYPVSSLNSMHGLNGTHAEGISDEGILTRP